MVPNTLPPRISNVARILFRVLIGRSPRTTYAGLAAIAVVVIAAGLGVETISIAGYTLTPLELGLVAGYLVLARVSGDGGDKPASLPTEDQLRVIRDAFRYERQTPDNKGDTENERYT